MSHPGPRRPVGAPVGPDAVRRAVLDAAAELFGHHGVQATSLRDIAAAADVQLALIARYVGTRDELIVAVFDDLAAKVVADLEAQPLEAHGFGRDATALQFTVVLSYLAVTGNPHLEVRGPAANPVAVLADQIVEHYGLDAAAARLRAAQVLASALGWRLFEPYLRAGAELDDAGLEAARADLVRQHRRTGATPYPTPPDPTSRRALPN